MNKNLSAVKSKSLYLLRHEQGHFDIAELFARKIRKYLEAFSSYDCDLIAFSKKIAELSSQKSEFNKLYDLETNHSKNPKIQKEWENRIDSLLNVYKDYERRIYIEDIL